MIVYHCTQIFTLISRITTYSMKEAVLLDSPLFQGRFFTGFYNTGVEVCSSPFVVVAFLSLDFWAPARDFSYLSWAPGFKVFISVESA